SRGDPGRRRRRRAAAEGGPGARDRRRRGRGRRGSDQRSRAGGASGMTRAVASCRRPAAITAGGPRLAGLPGKPVRVGERPGLATDREAVRAVAVGGDAGVLGEGTAPVERQLEGTRRTLELDVFVEEALAHGEAALDV